MILDDYVVVTASSTNLEYYKNLGYVVSGKNDYISIRKEHLTRGSMAKVTVACDKCGKQSNTWYFSYCDVLDRNNGEYLCIKCSHAAYKIDFMEVLKTYFKKDCTPVFLPDDYLTEKSILKYRCNKHSYIGQKSFKNFRRNKNNCPICLKETFGGINHPMYVDGSTKIKAHVRSKITPWVKFIMHRDNYICQISGKSGGVEVHHVTPFNSVFYEVMNNLDLPIKEFVTEYTDKELLSIENAMLDAHYQQVIGITLSKDIHKELHRKFGYTTTSTDLEEYVKQYKEVNS